MKKIVLLGVASKGRLTLSEADLSNYITWKDDKHVWVTLEEFNIKRSNNANRYYWGVVVSTITNYFNDEKTFNRTVKPETVHRLLKKELLGVEVASDGNTELEIEKETHDMSQEDFQEYVENCRQWATDMFGILIPEPLSYV